MNPRLLAFPVAVSVIAALDACAGISITDPSVRQCHDDTSFVEIHFPDGRQSSVRVIRMDDPAQCRPIAKAA